MGRELVLLTPRDPPSTHTEWIVDELQQRLGNAVTDCRTSRQADGLIAVEGDYTNVAVHLDAIEPDWPIWLDHVRVSAGRTVELLHR